MVRSLASLGTGLAIAQLGKDQLLPSPLYTDGTKEGSPIEQEKVSQGRGLPMMNVTLI